MTESQSAPQIQISATGSDGASEAGSATGSDSSHRQGSLSMRDLGDLAESFAVFDRGGEGKIDSSKLYRVLTSVIGDNPTEAEVQDLIIANDADGGGTIEFDEFVTSMKDKMQLQPTERDLKHIYKMMDRNQSGTVVLENLVGFLNVMGAQLTSHDVELMFQTIDVSGKREITYDDFVNVVMCSSNDFGDEQHEVRMRELGITPEEVRVVRCRRDYLDDLELD